MKRKIKILLAVVVSFLFIWACYLIYNMKDSVKPVQEQEETKINDIVVIKKRNLENISNEYYYVEFNFLEKEATLYRAVTVDENVREGETAITVYKQANLYLNDIELENYQKNLNKIYNNPYRYSYLNVNDAKKINNGSNDYYEIEFLDSKYFIYEKNEQQFVEKLFE